MGKVYNLCRVCETVITVVFMVMSGLDPRMINLFEVDNKSLIPVVVCWMILCLILGLVYTYIVASKLNKI